MGLQLGCTSFKALLSSTGALIPPAEGIEPRRG